MSFATLIHRAGRFTTNHSPALLTAIGVAGTITTAVLAAKASFKAAEVIHVNEEYYYRGGSDPRLPREVMKDRFDLTWKLYIPAVTCGAASIVCIIAAQKVGARRAAGLAAATTVIEKSFEEYKEKVAEKFGPRKEEQVRDEVAQDQVTRTYSPDVELYGIADQQLCFDAFSGRYFRGTVEGIRSAINSVNNIINHDGNVTLGELYRILEIPATEYSEEVGWNTDQLVEEQLSSVLTAQGDQVIVLNFRNPPGPDYGRFRRI